jgi:molecular chaperone DnaJ
MSEKRDYYEVLGISRDASSDEIRRAYRQSALKHHPDRNPGDQAAEAKFKEATEAYSVLSDAEKRSTYDRFGHAGMQNGGFDFSNVGIGDILSQFQDMFADFFGGFGGVPGHGRQRAPRRGQDIRVDASISLEDAMVGAKHEVKVHGLAPCEACAGSGARGQGPRARPLRSLRRKRRQARHQAGDLPGLRRNGPGDDPARLHHVQHHLSAVRRRRARRRAPVRKL